MKSYFISSLLVILSLFVLTKSGENYTLVLLSQQRGAACLDGSPVGLYIHEGKGINKDNFVVYFEGGGFYREPDLAGTLENCYQRTKGRFGTTKVCEPTTDLDRKGIIATQQQINPVFYDWTKIYAIYCDGAQYFGSRPDPIPQKDKKLYFRGTNNVLEQVKYLEDKYDIFRKNKIVVTGVSAGGIATYLYANLFQQKAITAKVFAIPDSGLFIKDYKSALIGGKSAIRQASKALLNIVWNEQRFPIQKCLQEFNNDLVECFNAKNLIKYIKPPMLMIQSAYDAWSMENIQGVTCYENKNNPYSIQNCDAAQMAVINDYRDQSRKAILEMIKQKPNLGVWSPSCIQHGFTTTHDFNSPNYKVPGFIGKMMTQAIQQFLQNPQNPPIYIDTVDWPNNKGCNGLNNKHIRIKQISICYKQSLKINDFHKMIFDQKTIYFANNFLKKDDYPLKNIHTLYYSSLYFLPQHHLTERIC